MRNQKVMDVSGFDSVTKILSNSLTCSFRQEEYYKQYSICKPPKHLEHKRTFKKCAVCSIVAAYRTSYGAIVCNACRTFFRRSIINTTKRPCKSEGNCIIVPQSKRSRSCGFCRFQTCLSVGMKPAMVEYNIDYRHCRYNKRVQVNDSIFHNRFQEKSPDSFDRKETSDTESKSSDDEISVHSSKSNELVTVSCSSSVASSIPCLRKPILWIKELWSTPMPQELLKFKLVDTYFQACDSIKIAINISLNPEFDADHQFFQSLMISHFKNNETVPSDSDSTSLYLQTTNGLITFHREASSIFNVHVSTISKEESSIVIMESLNDDHWTRLKEIISFGSILHQYTSVNYEVTTNPYPLDQIFNDFNQPRYTFILYTSVGRGCDIISKAIESLSLFSKLNIEDQLIILKESFLPIGCLIFNHKYDDEAESYVSTALNGKLSHCYHKDRLKIYSSNKYSAKLDQFHSSFLKFLVFLRTDFLVNSILSILCVLQENSGLSCTEFLEKERKYYCEILDAYIRAKVISNEWLSDVDVIWRNIHEIFFELSK